MQRTTAKTVVSRSRSADGRDPVIWANRRDWCLLHLIGERIHLRWPIR